MRILKRTLVVAGVPYGMFYVSGTCTPFIYRVYSDEGKVVAEAGVYDDKPTISSLRTEAASELCRKLRALKQ